MPGTFADFFDTFNMYLTYVKSLNPLETAAVQTSHYRAQLLFSSYCESTRLLLAVRIADSKANKSVMYCYALIYKQDWHIIDYDGAITKLCSSRLHQTLPQLAGAIQIRVFALSIFPVASIKYPDIMINIKGEPGSDINDFTRLTAR